MREQRAGEGQSPAKPSQCTSWSPGEHLALGGHWNLLTSFCGAAVSPPDPAGSSPEHASSQLQVCFSDAARENTNIFRCLFSQNVREFLHPSSTLFLAPLLGFQMPHLNIAFWEGGTTVLKKRMRREWFPKQQ